MLHLSVQGAIFQLNELSLWLESFMLAQDSQLRSTHHIFERIKTFITLRDEGLHKQNQARIIDISYVNWVIVLNIPWFYLEKIKAMPDHGKMTS